MKKDRWYDAAADTVAQMLIEHGDSLAKINAKRHALDLRHARLYGGTQIAGLTPWQYGSELSAQRLKLNVVASCVETAVSKLCKSRPAPQFLTNGADYDTRRKAEKLNKFGKGCLHQSGWYDLDPILMRDAATFGTAHVKHTHVGKVLVDERCLPWDVLVDPRECRTSPPRTLVHRYYMDKGVALARWAKGRGATRIERAIEDAQTPRRGAADFGMDETSDQIEIIEGWHLRSGTDADDGRHVIAVRTGAAVSGVLFDEDWTRDEFPFSKLTWEPAVVGYWGRGVAEKLTGIQFEMNALLIKIQESMRIHGRTFAFIDAASGVPVSHVDTALDTVFIVDNGARPPTVVANQSVHPELLAQVNTLYQRSFQEVGISEMSASSTKPAGLDSGKALREYNDIGSERLVANGRRRETFCLDGVRRKLEVARTIRGFTVDVPDRRQVTRVAWSDVNLRESEYVLQLFPASLLSQTPAGRRQDVLEMQSAQWIDREKALELMDIPDLDDLYAKATATQRHVREVMGAILDGGAAPPPEPRMRLDVALDLVTAVYLEESTNGAPEAALEQIRHYQDELTAMVAAMAPAAAPQSPPGMMPGGPPV